MKIKHGLLLGAVPSVNGTNVVKIACSPTHLSMAADADTRFIADVLKQIVGHPVTVELTELDTVPKKAAPSAASDAAGGGISDNRDVEKMTPLVRRMAAEDDAQLRTALNLFNAKILETQ